MNNIIRIVSLIGILAISQIAYSAGGGKDIAPGQKGKFSGFGTGFSPIGAAKNVVVQEQLRGNGDTRYFVRSFYASDSEKVEIDGSPTFRPFIANFASVTTDAATKAVKSIDNFIETPDTEDYITYNIEESFYDPMSLAKTVTLSNLRESFVCTGGGIHVCLFTDTLATDGTFQFNGIRTQVRGLTGPFHVNDMTFNEVRVVYDQGRSNNRTRVHAKGIGEIQRRDVGQNDRTLIYFQANGTTGGSLVGTPFDPTFNNPTSLHGLFF